MRKSVEFSLNKCEKERKIIKKPKFLKNASCLEQKTTMWKNSNIAAGKMNKLGKNRKITRKKDFLIPGSRILKLSFFKALTPCGDRFLL